MNVRTNTCVYVCVVCVCETVDSIIFIKCNKKEMYRNVERRDIVYE